jgi:hypothetical protein
MSITTNAELVTAVGNYLARSDLSSFIPDFIVGAETRINYGSEEPYPSQALRHREMEANVDFTIGAQTVALPSGFLEMRALYVTSNGVKTRLEQTSLEDIFAKYTGSESGTPKFYAVSGDNLVFGPSPSSNAAYTGTIYYYKKFDPVASANPVPWLLTNAPMVYVYGALLEAAPFIRNDQRLPIFHGMFTGLVGGLNRSSRRAQWGGSAMAVRNDIGNY